MSREILCEEVVKALKGFYADIILRAIDTGSPMITRELVQYRFEDMLKELGVEEDELS